MLILGLPRDLIEAFVRMWQALVSGLPLDPEKFRTHCGFIKRRFYETCPWAHMWPSLHKVFVVEFLFFCYLHLSECKSSLLAVSESVTFK